MIPLIKNMLSELDSYKHDKTTLMQEYIAARLDKSFEAYDKELSQSIEFLSRKHEKSLLKRITKINDKTG